MLSRPLLAPVTFSKGRSRAARNEAVAGRAGLDALAGAAPFAAAALWAGATAGSLLLWLTTGVREPFDACRSGDALSLAGALTAIAVLAAGTRRSF